jgi:alpha-1,6-mannosyltransferase
VRIVDVTQWHSPVSGGIRTYLNAKARWAAASGHDHGVVVTGAQRTRGWLERSPLVTVRGRTPSRRWGYRIALRPGPILAALDELEPDVVVLHDTTSFPQAIARWAGPRGVPVVVVVHSDLAIGAAGLPLPVRGPAAWALRLVQRQGLRAPRVVLVASQESRRRVAPSTPRPVMVSPLGVDLEPFAGAQPSESLRAELTAPGEAMLLYAGRLSGEKRVELLPEALARLGDLRARLVIAGTGAAEGRLLRVAKRVGVEERVRLLGYVGDRERLAELMASADVFVHPSPHEPFGLAPLEALASGCRVVAPRTGGTGETLAGREGAVLVAPDDAVALADGVREALTLPRPAPDLSELGWDATFSREWDLYRRLAEGRPIAPFEQA